MWWGRGCGFGEAHGVVHGGVVCVALPVPFCALVLLALFVEARLFALVFPARFWRGIA